jgi:hypothetical protein
VFFSLTGNDANRTPDPADRDGVSFKLWTTNPSAPVYTYSAAFGDISVTRLP